MATSASGAVVGDIEAELTALSVPAVLHAGMMLAIDKAGYGVEPAGGGTFSLLADGLDAAYWAVEGVPGLAVVGVTLPDASVVYRLATAEDLARRARTPSLAIPATSAGGATPASLSAIGVELDVLRLPQSLLGTLVQAIDDAGYELSPKTTGAAVAAGTPLAVTLANVLGFPGMIMVTVTMPDASTLSRMIADRELIGETTTPGTV